MATSEKKRVSPAEKIVFRPQKKSYLGSNLVGSSKPEKEKE